MHLASALLFVIHLHGMMFALANGGSAGSLARSGVLPVPSSVQNKGVQPAARGGLGMLGCRGHPRWWSFRVGALWWWEQRAYEIGATSCWQEDEVYKLIGLFHFNVSWLLFSNSAPTVPYATHHIFLSFLPSVSWRRL